MHILATADLHGNRPEVEPCDLLLIGGDICPLGYEDDYDLMLKWLDGPFRNWLAGIEAKQIIGIAGNHDFIFQYMPTFVERLHLPWTYLKDSETEYEGLRIYGMPWVPNLSAWAFFAPKEALKERYDAIPKEADIILSHGPVHGYGDTHYYSGEKLGCKSGTDMLERVKPKAFVCGHIHEGFGSYRYEGRNHITNIYNVSYVDETYAPRFQIIEIDLSADVMDDPTVFAYAPEDETNPERELHSADSDARSSSESLEGSEPGLVDVASF